jgi:hypothetical protein
MCGLKRDTPVILPSGFAPPDCGISAACLWRMMTTLFILTALAAAGLFTELLAASHAPLGYQDETGFHFGADSTGFRFFDHENPS